MITLLVLFLLSLFLKWPVENGLKFIAFIFFIVGWQFALRYLLKRIDEVNVQNTLDKVLSYFDDDLHYFRTGPKNVGNWIGNKHGVGMHIPSLKTDIVEMSVNKGDDEVYQGIVFCWEHNFQVKEPIYILKDHAERKIGSAAHLLQRLRFKLPKLIITEDREFEYFYQVRCDSKEQFYSIFTPGHLNRLVEWKNGEKAQLFLGPRTIQICYTSPDLERLYTIDRQNFREYFSYEPFIQRYLLADILHQKMEEIFGPDIHLKTKPT